MMEPKRPKYMPDVERVLRECEPEVLEARTREAARKAYEAGLIDRLTPEPVKRPSAPSPRAKGAADAAGAAEIDKEALPSAMAPAAEERPVTKTAAPARGWPATWKLVAAFAAVAVVAPFLSLAISRSVPKTERAASTAGPSTVAAPSVATVVMRAATATAALSASAAPSAAMPSASAAVSAPPLPAKARPKLNTEPRDAGAAPSPPATVEPAVKTPTEDNPVF